MVRLEAGNAASLFAGYSRSPSFFPLIGAVLEGQQEGIVLADDAASPCQVYVEHAFGFAQIFGGQVVEFESSLARYFEQAREFSAPKVRLYTPLHPAFLDSDECRRVQSWRQRFRLPGEFRASPPVLPRDTRIAEASAEHVDAIESAFGVVTRFWRTPADFVARSRAVLVLQDGRPASLCYAAAVSGHRAEIDVLTLPEFRNLGLGRLSVHAFNARCLREGIAPLWDCFTNNTGSMQLCRATGFVPASEPYPFYTFNRKPV